MFKKIFFSFWMSLILLFIYAISCAVATFIENDFGTNAAKVMVYNAFWFDLLHLLLLINLVGIIFIHKLFQRKKYAALLLHCAFIVILLGAGITRYFGIEGGMHIREGQSSNIVVTRDEFIALMLYNNNGKVREYQSFGVTFNPFLKNTFKKEIVIKDKKIDLELLDYEKAANAMTNPIIKMKISFNGDSKEILLVPNYNNENVLPFRLGGEIFALNWGPEEIELPFSINLKDFILERYAGSMSPSSYASDIEVIDKDKSFEYKIFMNNVLDYGGYRFFQSSYDQDEQGTIFSVNKDPGKIPTYIGYTLLICAFIWILFDKRSRFAKLSNYLKNQKNFVLVVFCLFIMHTKVFAEWDTLKLVQSIKDDSLQHSLLFGSLLVQDFDGRIKPIDTVAMNYIHKITKKNSFLGLNYNQIFLGMMMYPQNFQYIKMISIKTPKLKSILGVDKNEKYIAYNDVFDKGFYKLSNYVEEASRKKPALRDQFDKDVLTLDEKINSAFYIYSGEVFRIFPDPSQKTYTWYSPATNMPFNLRDIENIRNLLLKYFFDFNQGLINKDFSEANENLEKLKKFQKYYAQNFIPSKIKINLEIFLNHYNIFENLTFIYLCLGAILFVLIFYEILSLKKISKWIKRILFLLISCSVIVHVFALIIRWYVGDHAPWSNAYESMVYIAFACAFSGLIFYKKSSLVLCTASIMAGIALFVAHLGFMDPQITNLVPVLKSYWLNIHVSIITASYGFLGLCFLLGIFTLFLFILRNQKRKQVDQSILNLHCVNEMAMILGLALLTIGNFLGGVWANESWGRYWGWDSKETWALISIVVYTIILHLRFISIFNNPYVFATASVAGFYSILMTYFGVNFYLSGLHSYAAGDPMPIPKFLYFFVIFTLFFIIGAFFKRKLESPI
ncbi:cytochrome c biogenesis protein [Campylobacter aviculae]|uniref:Cytochrome C biogenesis protein n=1 Tax=Campylobacter aviculae TaxID=2510190 RepID=A0A4U7BLW8_9BACT|nr:cytochrome c biogenesis protein CcsA [Campylobacter aviculae]TKX31205.1 cytochrome C biogenesis protein [Campylobacter aviculae]